MPAYVALLRGINVGGNKKIAMADLRELAGDLGLRDPVTLLQSGNLIFTATSRSVQALEQRLDEATAERLGVETMYIIRTAAEWQAVVAGNPFPGLAASNPSHLLVSFSRATIPPAAESAVQKVIVGRERVRVAGRECYIEYPDGIGTSKLTPAVIERAAGKIPATARNWNTVLKIAAALEDRAR